MKKIIPAIGFLLLALTGAHAQSLPVGCTSFSGFPLTIALGQRQGVAIVGSESAACANTKIMAAVNTLASQRGAANGIATLDANGYLPLTQFSTANLAVPLTGAPALRFLSDRFSLIRSPEDFGAIADGASHPLSTRYGTFAAAQAVYPFVTALTQEIDWAAAQAAANTATFVNYSAKDYFLGNNAITTANRAAGHLFKGFQQTRFICTGAPCGFRHSDNRAAGAGANARGTFTFKGGATIVTKIANGGTAVSIDMRVAGAVLASAVYGGPSALDIDPVQIVGDDDFAGQGQHYWNIGIDLIDTGTVTIPGANILGAFTKANTVGIRIENSTGANTEFFINNPKIKYVEKYIEIVPNSRTIEGVYINQPSMVGARVGINVTGGLVHSLEVAGGHIDAKEAVLRTDATTRGSDAFFVHDAYLQLSNQYDGTYATGGKLFDLDGSIGFKASGNHIVSFDPTKSQFGVSGLGTDRASIYGNTFINFAKATTWGANSAGTAATNNLVASSNVYQGNTAISDAPVAGSTNYIERTGTRWAERANGEETRFGTVTVTLDSSGAAAIPFTQQMKRAPDAIKLNNASFTPAGALGSAVSYNASGATVDSFTLALSPNPGAVAVTVSYEAVSRAPTPQ